MNRRAELLTRLADLQTLLQKSLSSQEGSGHLGPFQAVTMHQLSVLRRLVDEGPLTMHELGSRLEIGPSAVTQLVDRLAEHELVERVPDSDDRRVFRIVVTKSANEAVERFKKWKQQQLISLVDRLSDEEFEQFVRLAEKMVGRVEEKV